MTTPFLKWAGGKARLADRIVGMVPDRTARYFEPFLGGGAVFFRLVKERGPQEAYLNDSNPDLIECYRVVRDSVADLIDALHELAVEYARRGESRRDFYYEVRDSEPRTPVERAARLMFLNKTGYNGLYRVNSEGAFNVPFGAYANPRILNASNLLGCSAALKYAELSSTDFEAVCAAARADDFVYFDPPYHPLSPTSSFTSYTSESFGAADQRRLARLFGELTSRGVLAVLSNSDHELIRDLYDRPGNSLDQVLMSRAINSNASRRSPISELLVTNIPSELRRHALSSSPK